MKKLLLLLYLIFNFIFWSCSESNPNYVQNYYTNYWVEYNTLNPSGWTLLDTANNIWNQTIKMTLKSNINYGDIGIICYYKNKFKVWEVMPAKGIAKDAAGKFFQDELTYANDSLNLYINYKNAGLFNPMTNLDTLQIKTVFFDGKYTSPVVLIKQLENDNK